ncbi:MAG: hypothetical protein NC302_10715 [Bacteroidales bacterium]|nr:hypothetical protein [Bacteroidales bacterium]MCM1415077.1 hypothetical protein [bacterium]MCM1424258.1 hypothetical protein [bacterium]
MKKFLALSLALAMTFSTTVCAAEQYPKLGAPLSAEVEKTLSEYQSNAISGSHYTIGDAIEITIPAIASGSGMIIGGVETNATCVVDKPGREIALYGALYGMNIGAMPLVCAKLTAPGVDLTDAEVKLYVENVAAGDAISVYKCVEGEWEPVTVTAVDDNCVQFVFDYQGGYAIMKDVPAK